MPCHDAAWNGNGLSIGRFYWRYSRPRFDASLFLLLAQSVILISSQLNWFTSYDIFDCGVYQCGIYRTHTHTHIYKHKPIHRYERDTTRGSDQEFVCPPKHETEQLYMHACEPRIFFNLLYIFIYIWKRTGDPYRLADECEIRLI